MKKVLLDTNAYVRFLLGNEDILEVLSKAEVVYMSVFVLGELHAGFMGGRKRKDNYSILERFLSKPTVRVLDATSETAEIFGQIKSGLKKAGTPIPINDVWLASHTVESGSTLVTFDRHFTKVSGLRLLLLRPG